MYSRCASGSGPVTRGGRRPEVVARRAVPDVELVADDRVPHRVPAEQELAVFDGVEA